MYLVETYWYPGEGDAFEFDTWEEALLYVSGLTSPPPDQVAISANPSLRSSGDRASLS